MLCGVAPIGFVKEPDFLGYLAHQSFKAYLQVKRCTTYETTGTPFDHFIHGLGYRDSLNNSLGCFLVLGHLQSCKHISQRTER